MVKKGNFQNISPYEIKVLEDIYDTAFKGFSSAKASANGKDIEINTGRFGAGIFENDPIAVYVVQKLAAQQAGVKRLNFHKYSQVDIDDGDEVLQKVMQDLPPSSKPPISQILAATRETLLAKRPISEIKAK